MKDFEQQQQQNDFHYFIKNICSLIDIAYVKCSTEHHNKNTEIQRRHTHTLTLARRKKKRDEDDEEVGRAITTFNILLCI